MSDRVFFDTNIFVYLFDRDAPDKQRISRNLLDEHGKESRIVLSMQVLQEFYVTVTRKLALPLAPAEAEGATRGLSVFPVVQTDPQMIFRAIALSQEEQLSFWDALIIRAALEGDCSQLLSEDLQHGRRFESLTIENPYR
jgi:predicted nucleic acid-binding protein